MSQACQESMAASSRPQPELDDEGLHVQQEAKRKGQALGMVARL